MLISRQWRSIWQSRVVMVIILSILLMSCHATTQAELAEEVGHVISVGMPTSVAISRLGAAGFQCEEATEGGPLRGTRGGGNSPPPSGWTVRCDRTREALLTCVERVAVWSEKEPSTVSSIDVEKPACLGTP